jgi:hypothetical protein
MLLWVDEMFVPFLNYIFQFRKDGILKTNKQSKKVLYLLKILIEQIERKNVLRLYFATYKTTISPGFSIISCGLSLYSSMVPFTRMFWPLKRSSNGTSNLS